MQRLQPPLPLLLCLHRRLRHRQAHDHELRDRPKRAIDFVIEKSGQRRNLEVDFFGGEPLLNWQVVKDLVAYGRRQEKIHNKNFRFTLTTNGVLLNDEVQEFVNREMANRGAQYRRP